MDLRHNLTKDGSLIIYQNTNLNSFTFDSLLLSNFTTVSKRTSKVVDLCSGNGPIAMLLCNKKKNGDIKVEAVEIQEEIARLGIKSVEENKMADKVSFHIDNLIGISETIGYNKYNLVTCNPPYFKVDDDSNINPNKSIAMARHELSVDFEQVVVEARKLLDNIGVFSFVHRPERLEELISTLNKHGFTIKRMQLIHPKKSENANTVLIEAKKGQSRGGMKILESMVVYTDEGEYTVEALKVINQ